jgi:hypothetical protein
VEAFVLPRELLDRMLAVIDRFITDHAQREQPCPCPSCAEACQVYKQAMATAVGREYD